MSVPLTQQRSGLWLPSRELWVSAGIGRYGGVRWGGTSYEIAQPNEWDDLSASWPMWRGAGYTAEDISVYGNHGTLTNMDPSTDWVQGRNGRGGSLDVNGVNGYVNIGQGIYTASLSVSAWINGTSFSDRRSIAGVYDNLTNNRSWFFGFSSAASSLLDFGFSDSGVNYDFQTISSDVIVPNTWTHVVATYRNGNVAMYNNGVSQSLSQGPKSGTPNGALYNATVDLRIGAVVNQSSDPSYFEGLLDDVRIYNRTLTDLEVATSHSLGTLSHLLLRRRPTAVAFPSAVSAVSYNQLVLC